MCVYAQSCLTLYNLMDCSRQASLSVEISRQESWSACLFQFWFPRCVCPAVGLLGHMAVLFPVFQGISTLFSIEAVLVCIPTNSVRGFPFLHTKSGIAGSHGNSKFNLLRNCQTVFQSSYTILHSHLEAALLTYL